MLYFKRNIPTQKHGFHILFKIFLLKSYFFIFCAFKNFLFKSIFFDFHSILGLLLYINILKTFL